MKNANFTSFPGVDVAFISALSQIPNHFTIVAADPGFLSNRKALIDILKGNVNKPYPGRLNPMDNACISAYIFRDDLYPYKYFKRRPVIRSASDISGASIVLLNAKSWDMDLIDYYERGFRRFAALPSNFIATGWRRVIMSRNNGFVFLHNYKVMYSAMRDFMRENLLEFADRPAVSHALSSYADLEKRKFQGYFKFSIVRNPWDRVTSAYRDKLCRSRGHKNFRLFNESIGAIMSTGTKVDFETFIRYIAKIPDSHCNRHWLSQYVNIHLHGRILVDYVGKYEHLETSLQKISENTGF
jgi:hypothetical protein